MTNNLNAELDLAQIRIDRLIGGSLIIIDDFEFELTKKGKFVNFSFRFLQFLFHKDMSKIQKRIESSINE